MPAGSCTCQATTSSASDESCRLWRVEVPSGAPSDLPAECEAAGAPAAGGTPRRTGSDAGARRRRRLSDLRGPATARPPGSGEGAAGSPATAVPSSHGSAVRVRESAAWRRARPAGRAARPRAAPLRRVPLRAVRSSRPRDTPPGRPGTGPTWPARSAGCSGAQSRAGSSLPVTPRAIGRNRRVQHLAQASRSPRRSGHADADASFRAPASTGGNPTGTSRRCLVPVSAAGVVSRGPHSCHPPFPVPPAATFGTGSSPSSPVLLWRARSPFRLHRNRTCGTEPCRRGQAPKAGAHGARLLSASRRVDLVSCRSPSGRKSLPRRPAYR